MSYCIEGRSQQHTRINKQKTDTHAHTHTHKLTFIPNKQLRAHNDAALCCASIALCMGFHSHAVYESGTSSAPLTDRALQIHQTQLSDQNIACSNKRRLDFNLIIKTAIYHLLHRCSTSTLKINVASTVWSNSASAGHYITLLIYIH